MLHTRIKRGLLALTTLVSSFALVAVPTAVLAQQYKDSKVQQSIYADAAKEFGVPESMLLAVAYYQTGWETHAGQMSADGGFGPLNLRTDAPAGNQVEDGRGDPRRPISPKAPLAREYRTLDKAAALLNVSPETLKSDTKQNIRGGAAVLADKARTQNNGQLPSNMGDWYTVAADYIGQGNKQSAGFAIDELQSMLQKGASSTTTEGQSITLKADPGVAAPNDAERSALGFTKAPQQPSSRAECPRTLTCRYIPANYGPKSADPTNYGTYDHANRPNDMKVKYIVIHDTEGTYQGSIDHLLRPESYVSAHYILRSSDGEVTQMVDTQDVAWHAGDWYVNMHSIGIEHEGEAVFGARWYTEAMYRASAQLVRYLAQKYDIPLDRQHIIGHNNVPGLTDARVPTMHWDPGPYWDWDHYMALIRGEDSGARQPASALTSSLGLGGLFDNNSAADTHGRRGRNKVATISPTMPQNILTLRDCYTDPAACADRTAPANLVFMRSQPRADAPLVKDPLLHPDGSPGTNQINDWTAIATAGQSYAFIEQQGDWTAVWFAGQKAWFHNPASQPTARIDKAKTITLKPGLTEANVYGGAYPETSVYPTNVNGPQQPRLSYKMLAGQKYVSAGLAPTDYFYDITYNYSMPHDHEVFSGSDKYYQIWYNQRVMYVKASDVVVN